MMKGLARSYRFDPITVELLERLAQRWGLSQAGAIRLMVRQAARRERLKWDEPAPELQQDRPRVVELAATPALDVYRGRAADAP